MAYITKEEVAEIRKELKEAYPNIKFSVRTEHLTTVSVSIMESDIDFCDLLNGRDDCQIVDYGLHKFGEQGQLLENIFNIIKSAPAKVKGGTEWYDNSDSMADYFDTAFFYHVSIGRWDRPYKLKAG